MFWNYPWFWTELCSVLFKERSRDRKIVILWLCDRDHLEIVSLNQDRRSPRDHEKKIADRDQKIGDRSCLGIITVDLISTVDTTRIKPFTTYVCNERIFDSPPFGVHSSESLKSNCAVAQMIDRLGRKMCQKKRNDVSYSWHHKNKTL